MSKPNPPRDEAYWSIHDLEDWQKGRLGRGIPYQQTGAAVATGTKNQVRKISSGRKAYRGMASDSFKGQS